MEFPLTTRYGKVLHLSLSIMLLDTSSLSLVPHSSYPADDKMDLYKRRCADVHFQIAFQENRLYWCDARTDKIERINLETGESREIVLSAANVDLFSVAVFGAYIYWSDR